MKKTDRIELGGYKIREAALVLVSRGLVRLEKEIRDMYI